MAECYNAAGNPDPTQYVNASGVCVQAGGRRRRSSRSTRNRRVGGGNNNNNNSIERLSRMAKYLEHQMNAREAAGKKVNVRGNPVRGRRQNGTTRRNRRQNGTARRNRRQNGTMRRYY
jgi:hypothetical protein